MNMSQFYLRTLLLLYTYINNQSYRFYSLLANHTMKVTPTEFIGTSNSCRTFEKWVNFKTDNLYKNNKINSIWNERKLPHVLNLWRCGTDLFGDTCGIMLWKQLRSHGFSVLDLYWYINTSYLREYFAEEIQLFANRVIKLFGIRCKNLQIKSCKSHEILDYNKKIYGYDDDIRNVWSRLQYGYILDEFEEYVLLVDALGDTDFTIGNKLLYQLLLFDLRIMKNMKLIKIMQHWFDIDKWLQRRKCIKKPKTTLQDQTIFNDSIIGCIIPFMSSMSYIQFAKCNWYLYHVLSQISSLLLSTDFIIYESTTNKEINFDPSCSSKWFLQVSKRWHERSCDIYCENYRLNEFNIKLNNLSVLYKGAIWNYRLFPTHKFQFIWNTVEKYRIQCFSWGASVNVTIPYFVFENRLAFGGWGANKRDPILFNAETLIIYHTILSQTQCSYIFSDINTKKIIFWESSMELILSFYEVHATRVLSYVSPKIFLFVNMINPNIWFILFQWLTRCRGWYFISSIWILSSMEQIGFYTRHFLDCLMDNEESLSIKSIHIIFIKQESDIGTTHKEFQENVLKWLNANVKKINNCVTICKFVITVICIECEEKIVGHTFDIRKAMGYANALKPHLQVWEKLSFNNIYHGSSNHTQEWDLFCTHLFE